MPNPIKLVLSVGLLAVGGISGIAAFEASVGSLAPAAALGLWPPSGDVYAAVATQQLVAAVAPQATAMPRNLPTSVARLSRRALLLEPTNTMAMRDLALFYASRGHRDAARKLMYAALAANRRDPGVNLWLTEDLGRQGRDLEALRLYDITIRTDTAAANSLMRLMAEALGKPGAVDSLDHLLASNPPWLNDFWTAVLSAPSDLDHAFELRQRLHRRGLAMAKDHDALLIARLANSGKYTDAFALYRMVAPTGTSPEMLVDGGFEHAASYPPIGWRLASDSNFGSAIDEGTGQLVITALPGAEGTVAQQLVQMDGAASLLMQANYSGTANSKLALHITCAGSAGGNALDKTFDLPPSHPVRMKLGRACDFAWVSVTLPRDSDPEGRDFRVDFVSMRSSR